MGYYASGSGVLKLKSEVPEDVLVLLSWENAGFSEVADSPDGGLWLTFEYSKFHDDDMVHAMNKIAQYVESGDVEFCGEDGSHWRYHFRNGKMEEQGGEIVYKSDKPKKTYRIVFMRRNEDRDSEHDYYFDGVSIEVDNQAPEHMFVDLINKFEQYVDENEIEDVSVNEIYEEE